jgi:prevent-host-death family protein
MLSVKSSDLQKSFGKYLEKSLQEPIAVVKYERPTAYLISAAQFEALMESYQRVMRAGTLSGTEIARIKEASVETDAPFNLDDLDEDGKLTPA